jgi:hypothetical protein
MINLRRATLGWLHAVLAPNVICLLFVVGVTIVALWVLAMHYAFHARYMYSLGRPSEMMNLFIVLISAMTAYYGLMRSTNFHPALDYRYHEWLRSTPWTPGSPLPEGPLAPVWQDAVVLTAATLVTASFADQTANPVAATLGPCLGMAIGLALGWTIANVVTRNLIAAYGAFLTAPLALHATMHYGEASFAVAAVAAAIVAYLGVAAGLRSYPWTIFPKDKQYFRKVLNPYGERTLNWKLNADVGWPYAQLLSPPADCRFSRRRAATEAIIAAAWASALTRLIPLQNQSVAWGAVAQLTMITMIFKLAANLPLLCPKFCLGERIFKLRPIIWRHDRILVEALAVGVGVAIVAAVWFRVEPSPHWIGVGIGTGVGVWLFRRLGRPVAERFYTGPQMIAGVAIQPQNFKRLTAPGE